MDRRASLQTMMALAVLLGCVAHPASGQTSRITTESLLDEMTDLTAMALFPSPGYTCRQFSSYDRASKSPTEGWFANNDCGQYLRVGEKAGHQEYVMMDAEGPGAIVRIWSANPAGNLRITIDGSDRPVIDANMSELLGGKAQPLVRPIAGEYSKGWNLYFPIPYARHCKVTSDKGGFYYHVNYRTYPAGTPVESFSPDQLTRLSGRIARLSSRLVEPRGRDSDLGGRTEQFELSLSPGQTERQEFSGPQAFTGFAVRLAAADREAGLRAVIVKMSFDGESCIAAPLGDFFGSAPGINPFETLPLGMTKDGEMYSHWFMPFKDSATLSVTNLGKEAVTLSGEFAIKDYEWTDRSMHFHAKWRSQFDVATRPMQDWNYLNAKGKGVFAGVSFSIDNPVKAWWGEGDEKIYVDGETFPSHFGTGTEDYYGYAWCWPAVFTQAYHSQSRVDGPANYGRTSVNRFHVLDRIPFTRDFRFDMELWHWDEKCKVNMAVTAYWYACPGGSDAFKPIQAADAIVRPMPGYVVPRVAGALEGEELKIVKVTGTAEPQDWDDASAGKHLWWHAGMKPGDQLTVSLPCAKAGKYHVLARFLSAKDYGIHQLAINDAKAGGPRDFYNPDVKLTQETDLGVFALKAGDNTFSATVVGANDKAVKAYMFGLDYIRLQSAQ